MKRFNLIFAVVVVTAFVSAFIVERSRSRNVLLPDYAVPPKEVLDPLEAPRGEHTLTGTIVAHTGHPAAGVFVHLRLVEGDLRVADPMFFENTDENGRFELAHLPAGRYEVVLLSTGVPNTQWDDFTMPLAGAEGGVRWTLPEPYSELPVLPEIVRADLVGVLVLPEAIADDDWSLEGYEVVLS
ncbi:MAG: carboxypeptidase-like regulatory domain-containing protein, partial [Planctomycetota bacterium]|nr:carboxypeptidase-like regulatory domain-containing protein [Planctomycetota bacterium]